MKRNKLSYAVFLFVIAGMCTPLVVGQNNDLQRLDEKPRRLRATLPQIASPISSDSETSVPQYQALENAQHSQNGTPRNPMVASAVTPAGGRQMANMQPSQNRLVSHDAGNDSETQNQPAALISPRDNSPNTATPNTGRSRLNQIVPQGRPTQASATLAFSGPGTDQQINQASQNQHIGTMSVNGNGNWNTQDDIPEHVVQGISQMQEPVAANANSAFVPNANDQTNNQAIGQSPRVFAPGTLTPEQLNHTDFAAIDPVTEGSPQPLFGQQSESGELIPFRSIQPAPVTAYDTQENFAGQSQSENTRMSFGSPSAVSESVQPAPLQAENFAPQSRLVLPEEQVARGGTEAANIRYDGSSVQLGNMGNDTLRHLSEQEGNALPGANDLVGAQIPQLVIEKLMPSEVQIGEPMTIKINIRNTGAAKAKSVMLVDRLPKGSRFLEAGASGSCDPSGNICWALGDLNINEERTVELRVVPTAEGEIGSVATATFSVEASGSTRVTKPGLKMEVSTASEEHLVGGNLVLEIHLSNPGSGVARNIMIEEYVPDGLLHPQGKKLSTSLGDLKPNESKRLRLTLKCERAGETTNYLVAKAENDLIVESKIPIIVLAPGLLLDIAGPKNRYLERKATYELKVENPGSATAHEVQLVAQLPRGIDFDSTDSMGVYDPETHTVHWMLDMLPSQQSGTIKLITIPHEIGEHKIEFVGRARGNLQANATHEVSVDGIAALGFEITNKTGPVELGRDAMYEIRVFNRGTKASSNIGLCVQLPEDMRFVDANGPTQSHVSGSTITFNDLLQLEPRSEKTYTIKAQCLATGDHRVIVQMQSDEMERPVTKEENTNVYGDE